MSVGQIFELEEDEELRVEVDCGKVSQHILLLEAIVTSVASPMANSPLFAETSPLYLFSCDHSSKSCYVYLKKKNESNKRSAFFAISLKIAGDLNSGLIKDLNSSP